MSRIILLGPACIKLDYFFTQYDRNNARALLIRPSTTTKPRIFWLMRCPNCGTPAVLSQRLIVTPASAVEHIIAAVEMLVQILVGSGSYDETGEAVEIDDACNIGLSPVELDYDELNRQEWHPIEWNNIKLAIKVVLGVDFTTIETAVLADDPTEFGGNDAISLYGQLSHGQPYYFLGKAGYWSQIDLAT